MLSILVFKHSAKHLSGYKRVPTVGKITILNLEPLLNFLWFWWMFYQLCQLVIIWKAKNEPNY